MDERYVRRYRELYERHWWWRAREELLLRTLPRVAPSRRPLEILDVGCGDGLFFRRLAPFGRVRGIETDPQGVTPGSPWADRIWIRPFDETFEPGARFDLILMLDVLEHFPDPPAALRTALELLAPGGRLVATVPAFRLLWTSHDDLNHHVDRYSRRRFRALAEAAGGRVLETRYFFQALAPAKLVVRALEAVLGTTPSLPGIPPAPVNRLLVAGCRIEQRLLGRWVPFGSSLLAVVARGASPEKTPLEHDARDC